MKTWLNDVHTLTWPAECWRHTVPVLLERHTILLPHPGDQQESKEFHDRSRIMKMNSIIK